VTAPTVGALLTAGPRLVISRPRTFRMARGRLLQTPLTTEDQFDAWCNAHSFSMSFRDAAVEQATVHELVLAPEKK
jgi:hypothetical protein